jgi:hypothetical protein
METTELYIAERIAGQLLMTAERGDGSISISNLVQLLNNDQIKPIIVKHLNTPSADNHYDAYIHDSCLVLKAFLQARNNFGLLHFPTEIRVASAIWWSRSMHDPESKLLVRRACSYQQMEKIFSQARKTKLAQDISNKVGDFMEENFLFDSLEKDDFVLVGLYLANALASQRFNISHTTVSFVESFLSVLEKEGQRIELEQLIVELDEHPREQLQLAKDWFKAFASSRSQTNPITDDDHLVSEAAAYLITPQEIWEIQSGLDVVEIHGLLGDHSSIFNGNLSVNWSGILHRYRQYSLV